MSYFKPEVTDCGPIVRHTFSSPKGTKYNNAEYELDKWQEYATFAASLAY